MPKHLQPSDAPEPRIAHGGAHGKIALYIGHNGSGLRPCIQAARHLRANTVAVLGGDDRRLMTQATAIEMLLRRLCEGEFDLVLAWLDEGAVASLAYMARLPSGVVDSTPILTQALTVGDAHLVGPRRLVERRRAAACSPQLQPR